MIHDASGRNTIQVHTGAFKYIGFFEPPISHTSAYQTHTYLPNLHSSVTYRTGGDDDRAEDGGSLSDGGPIRSHSQKKKKKRTMKKRVVLAKPQGVRSGRNTPNDTHSPTPKPNPKPNPTAIATATAQGVTPATTSAPTHPTTGQAEAHTNGRAGADTESSRHLSCRFSGEARPTPTTATATVKGKTPKPSGSINRRSGPWESHRGTDGDASVSGSARSSVRSEGRYEAEEVSMASPVNPKNHNHSHNPRPSHVRDTSNTPSEADSPVPVRPLKRNSSASLKTPESANVGQSLYQLHDTEQQHQQPQLYHQLQHHVSHHPRPNPAPPTVHYTPHPHTPQRAQRQLSLTRQPQQPHRLSIDSIETAGVMRRGSRDDSEVIETRTQNRRVSLKDRNARTQSMMVPEHPVESASTGHLLDGRSRAQSSSGKERNNAPLTRTALQNATAQRNGRDSGTNSKRTSLISNPSSGGHSIRLATSPTPSRTSSGASTNTSPTLSRASPSPSVAKVRVRIKARQPSTNHSIPSTPQPQSQPQPQVNERKMTPLQAKYHKQQQRERLEQTYGFTDKQFAPDDR
ncbi:hypothetical protein SARC_08467 [Sphaeroforma arctica JP610]|uniref:Uncharacterized protein n=1 Tax=Sphaeroforma arctica JP610 TaxID=667725 RepID=A0A0L0FRF5_9EUKA|nr:hypothetical protein SARC_08467 [Sphaeroforma arctica JP610]KNC79126.1 hypothetical protein SARC_08467 [Sphaeroforma arctica JP610]|eukprot:XP_014153028.1 hypothetical protein SARC_08467 [Sphaeroforma arctica JP610]